MNIKKTARHYKWQIKNLNEKIDAEESNLFNSNTTYPEFLQIKNQLSPMTIFHFNAREGFFQKLMKVL